MESCLADYILARMSPSTIFLIQSANDGDEIARKLLDAEELFLPTTERALRQLRHPEVATDPSPLPLRHPGSSPTASTRGVRTARHPSS